jgi:hypothetical protein
MLNGSLSGDILKLTEFLGEEVDGVLTARKIRGELLDRPHYVLQATVLHVNSNQPKSGRRHGRTGGLSVFGQRDPCLVRDPNSHTEQSTSESDQNQGRRST